MEGGGAKLRVFRGTPRIADRLLRALRFCGVKSRGFVDKSIADKALHFWVLMNVVFDVMDRNYCLLLLKNLCGPVGIETCRCHWRVEDT